MSQVSHFQVYSQRENHVTNNTLLMLRHVHRVSAIRFENVLQSCMDGDINVGPRFVQQQGESDSIPDALISQEPFYLYIEAKPFINLGEDQINRHLTSIESRNHPCNAATFLVISRAKLPESQCEDIRVRCKKKSIRFAATTYSDLIAALDKACENQMDLQEILEDFKSFIGQQGLLPEQYRWLVAMLCGTTWKENKQHSAYFEPASRNPKWAGARFLGLYHNKQISHIGRIEASIICREVEGDLKVEEIEFNDLQRDDITNIQRSKIQRIISDCEKHFGKFALEPYRFYLVEEFVETRIIKTSSGGMMGHRYFDLVDWVGSKVVSQEMSSKTVAELVRDKTFE